MSVNAAIRNYWQIHHGARPLRWSQQGGGTILIEGHPITYRVSRDGRTVFTILAGEDSYNPCFAMECDFQSNRAHLRIVKQRKNCFADGHNNMRLAVRAAYGFAKHKGMRVLTLADDSEIFCPMPVPLADLSFLTTGRTWYESIIPGLQCVSEYHDIEDLRRRASMATWDSVGADLLPDLVVSGGELPGSAMRVLQGLKEGRNHCKFFSRYMTLLVARSYGQSVMGAEWQCEIPQPPASHRHTARRSTRNIGLPYRSTRSARTNRIFR
jgi:hypothetical protein